MNTDTYTHLSHASLLLWQQHIHKVTGWHNKVEGQRLVVFVPPLEEKGVSSACEIETYNDLETFCSTYQWRFRSL